MPTGTRFCAAVAGGCLLALTADWRVARRGAVMGLNEVKVGVPLPWSAVMLLKTAAPAFAHTAVALLGRNFEGDAAVAYDGDGCQVWIIDDGLEGYAGRRFDPVTGLPICNSLYPPGTVVGDYQSRTPGISDYVPTN